jgi:membrane associated rhomboid family serine protease
VTRGFSFPGLPPIRTAAAQLAVALVLGSIVFAFGKTTFSLWLLLVPELVFSHFAFWQLLTYSFIETSPMGVIFGAIILWSIGGSLEQSWGKRRMVTFALGVNAAAALLTALLALALPAILRHPFAGGTVMTSALWVAYGLSWGERQTGFWGMPVSGNGLALIGVGFVFLNGAFGSWLAIIPDVFALAMTFAIVKLNFPGQTWERFNSWRLRRQLARRRAHLDVVSGQKRNMPTDSDRFLH